MLMNQNYHSKGEEMNIDYLTRKIKESDMSVIEIAKKAKISKQTIYNIMNKSHYPELDSVLDICKVLKLNGTQLAIVLGIKGE